MITARSDAVISFRDHFMKAEVKLISTCEGHGCHELAFDTLGCFSGPRSCFYGNLYHFCQKFIHCKQQYQQV
jgi:hypothetical protein